MFQGILLWLFQLLSVSLLLISTTVAVQVPEGRTAQRNQKKLVDDGYYEKLLEEFHLEEEQLQQDTTTTTKDHVGDTDRDLLLIESDGSLGSKCNFLTKCHTGLECFHNRCIPKRDCMKERLQEFDANFDSEAYKRAMFAETGVTEDDIEQSLRESEGDEVVFVQSSTMQSLIKYRQQHNEPFEPLLEIADTCAGRTGNERRRALLTTNRNMDEEDSDSVSGDGDDDLDPTQTSRIWTATIGLHLEGGLLFEVSLTAGYTGLGNGDLFVRRCVGAGIQAGIELSFYTAITFDDEDDSWACGSVLFDADAALGFALGIGLGICFIESNAVYLEYTVGVGIGAGIGFSMCGSNLVPALATPSPTPFPSTPYPTISSAPSSSSEPTSLDSDDDSSSDDRRRVLSSTLDPEYYERVLEELHREEQQLQKTDGDSDRGLLSIESDGSLGSICNFLTKCHTGLECFHNRCIPKRECMKEKLQEFDAGFDSEAYKRAMFAETGVTEDDLILSWRESDGDEVVFVQSSPMQSLIKYRQQNSEPFEPLADIVDICAGRTGNERRSLTNRNMDEESEDSDSKSADSSSTDEQDTADLAVTFGIHLEGGLIFELSLTVGWSGLEGGALFTRRCFGAGVQAGIELSFYTAITFDRQADSWECGSVLFDADAALGFALGIGLGICFINSRTAYLEYTIGAGIGAGIGFNICGANEISTPAPTPRPSVSLAPSVAPSISIAPSISSAPSITSAPSREPSSVTSSDD